MPSVEAATNCYCNTHAHSRLAHPVEGCLVRGCECYALSQRPVLSERSTPRIERLFAVVIREANGPEGIVRRDTPIGMQPFITDDEQVVGTMLQYAIRLFPADAVLRVVRFERYGHG